MKDQQKLKQAVEDCNAQQRAQKPGAVVVCMRDVQPESIKWLWPDYIPQGKITVFVGDPGVGKSMLTAALASNVSTGRLWPVGKAICPQGDVIMLCGEDDLGDTVRPRLDAAEADVSRVHAITMIKDVIEDGSIEERLFSLGRDIGHLETELENLPDARMVIIDPVTNYLGEGSDSYKDTDVRRVLRPLKELAEKYDVAVILIGHMNKATQSKAMYRMTGSLAFVALARAVYLVVKDQGEPERRLILPIKMNVAEDSNGLAYAIQSTPENVPYVVWEPDPVTTTAEEALVDDPIGTRTEREDTEKWLRDALAEGPMDATELKRAADASGISWRTLGRAKKPAGAISRKKGFGAGWEWVLLDDTESVQSEGCHEDAEGDLSHKSGTLRDTWHTSPENGQSLSPKDAKSAKDATYMGDVLRGTLGGHPGYPAGLFEAAAKAVSGLSLSAGAFISRLDPEDYQDVIDHPETARFCAEKWSF